MNTFAGIFDSTTAFLQKKGISPEISKGRKAEHRAVEQFQKQTGIYLPENFCAFYTDFADGFKFWWEMSDEVWGAFSIPSLLELAEKQQNWKRNVRDFLDDPTSLNQCVKPSFRPKAFQIWQKMESWIPFWDEGNGDHFCVDTPGGQILYDQHDWFDGFGSIAETNGIVAGENLEGFLYNRSRFCFRPDKSLWWGKFGEAGAIIWEPEYFDPEFYRGN